MLGMRRISEIRYLTALGLLLCVNLSVFWLMKGKVSTIKQREVIANQRAEFLDQALSKIKSERRWEIGTGGWEIPMALPVQTDGQSITTLGNWLGDSRKLLLFVSDLHCSTCIEQALFALKSRVPEIGRGNIRVLYISRSGSGPEWAHRRLILPGVPFGRIEPGGPAAWLEEPGFPVLLLAGAVPVAASPHLYLPQEETQNIFYLDQIARLFSKLPDNENR